jgi:hypothetical protein
MNVTGMLYGSRLLAHVDFPTSEVLGPGATEDQIQDLIDRHKLIFIKPPATRVTSSNRAHSR